MHKKPRTRTAALLQALFVTFLWSTSWVLIKIGLHDIPALTFAGLRYSLAFLCLLPFALQYRRSKSDPGEPEKPRLLSRRDWAWLILLGLLLYTFTQGAQFMGLAYLPAATVSLIFNFTSVVVAFLGLVFLAEIPTLLQWAGLGLFLGGALVYFYPASMPQEAVFGVVIAIIGMAANALSSVLGRGINRTGRIPPLVVTSISMGIGAAGLLGSGLLIQGLPALNLTHWLIIGWMAVVNTAFAFTLWNHTLRSLPAMESSIINSTMMVQIAVLAWIFLDETLSAREIAGMVLAALGAVLVQIRSSGRKEAMMQNQAAARNAKGEV